MTYTPNTPLALDYIDESQPVLNINSTVIDTVMSVDHYGFSAVSDNGKHKSVTTPDQSGHVTTTTDPAIYATEDIAAIGIMQFSRGASDAVPTPITSVHGTVASLATATPTAFLDLTGLTFATGRISARSSYLGDEGIHYVFTYRTGGTVPPLSVNQIMGGASFTVTVSSSTLRFSQVLNNPLADVRWTVSFDRAETT